MDRSNFTGELFKSKLEKVYLSQKLFLSFSTEQVTPTKTQPLDQGVSFLHMPQTIHGNFSFLRNSKIRKNFRGSGL